jgi:transmembrane sensor
MDWRMLPSEHLVSEATEWFARIHDPDQPSSTREEFTRWVLQSPAHIAAFLRVTRAWGDVGLAGENMPSLEELVGSARAEPDQLSGAGGLPSNVIALPGFSQQALEPALDEEKKEPQRSWMQRRWKTVAAVAATIVLAIPLGFVAADRWLDPSHIRTAIGEQRSVALADGSLVQLNTNSDLRVEFKPHERRIILRRGEARFTVAKDRNRPFLVETPQATVRALGTVFNVQIARQGTDVAVLEGHVEVTRAADEAKDAEDPNLSAPAALAERLQNGSSDVRPKLRPKLSTQRVSATRLVLATGERAAITQEGKILPDAGPPLERVVGWTDRRLVFREETLATLIAEVNRYHEKPIRIVDPEIAGLRISGTFAAYDLPSLVQYLERYRGVKSNVATDGGVELSRAD